MHGHFSVVVTRLRALIVMLLPLRAHANWPVARLTFRRMSVIISLMPALTI